MNTSILSSFRAVTAVASVGGLLLFAGCGSGPDAHVVSAPPPPVIVQQQQPAVIAATPTNQGTIVVTQAPPANPQVLVAQSARPSSNHVWIEGHWTVRNGRYEWINGAWELPPRSGSNWIAPRWERRSDGTYVFYESYWN